MFLFQALRQRFDLTQETERIFRDLASSIKSYYSEGGRDTRQLQQFLSWLNDPQNKKLPEQFKDDLLKGNIIRSIDNIYTLRATIGFWLGVKYAMHIGHDIGGSVAGERPKICIIPFHEFRGSFEPRSRLLTLMVPSVSIPEYLTELQRLSNSATIIMGFNLGLHEGTHALPHLFKIKDSELSEAATASVMLRYALPVKETDLNLDITGSFLGIRNFQHNVSEHRAGRLSAMQAVFLMKEYLPYVLHPWISNFAYSHANLSELTIDNINPETAMSIQNMVFSADALLTAHSGDEVRTLILKEMENRANYICQEMRIDNPAVISKITDTFKWIGLYAMENKNFREMALNDSPDYSDLKLKTYDAEMKKFLRALIKVLDSNFGKPSDPKIPKGYAHLDFIGSHAKPA